MPILVRDCTKKKVGTTKSWPIGSRDKESVYEIYKPLFLIVDSKPVT